MHTWEKHKDNIGNIIMKYQQGSEFIKPETILYRNHERIAALKKEVQIGVTGKFYCGGKLETPCKCCDGTCGPTNGENCVECMRLDQQKRNLQKGHLVNSSGRPCWP